MDEPFARVRSIVSRLGNILKCQKCLTLKHEDSMLFFHLCDHFYCNDCLGNKIFCLICENTLDKPIKLRDDKSILSLYQSFMKFELPSKEDIQIIYETFKKSKELHEQNLRNFSSEENEEINSNSDSKEVNEQIHFSSSENVEKVTSENCYDKKSHHFTIEKENSNVIKNSNITENLNTTENSNIAENSNTTGNSNIAENSNTTGNSNIAENSNTTGNSNISENLNITGNLNTIENLNKEANISFRSDLHCENLDKKQNTNTTKFSKRSKKKISVSGSSIYKNNSQNITSTQSSTFNTQSSGFKININKRNPKGETQLHIACKKSNFSLMKELINAGANLNAKDNAGWTPLHDSVFSGNIEVVKFLLDNGAKINIPGLENTTALHEAIAKENSKLVKLLLDYGADIYAKNIFRETPLDLVTKYNFTELKELLLEASKTPKNDLSLGQEDLEELFGEKALFKHNLNIDDEKLVNKFAEKFKWDLVSCLTQKCTPTHIVVPGEKFEITWRLISYVPYGCWIATIDWVKESLEETTPKSPEFYRPSKSITEGFLKAQSNRRNQLPDLFSGCHFFFGGNFEFYEVKNITIEKETLKCFIERNGGTIVKRCPDPESLALEKTIPFHANSSGSLRETSYFIIYQTEKWDPKPKYNMSHMKTLSVEWLVASIYKFELIDPKNFEGLDF